MYGGVAGEPAYDNGVRTGSLGLMLNAIVLAFMSLAVEPLGKMVGGIKRLWGIVNFILAIGLAMTVVITKIAEQERQLSGGATIGNPSEGVKISAMLFFAVLGIPMAIHSVFLLLSQFYCSDFQGQDQGLFLGCLESSNLRTLIP